MRISCVGEEESADLQQEESARIIQRCWRRHVHRGVFKYFKHLISLCQQRDPQTVLMTVNPREAKLLDVGAGAVIRFRLGGTSFPPSIYYKIFTRRPITDICSYCPKDYTKWIPGKTIVGWTSMLERKKWSGWSQQKECNSWRLFSSKAVCTSERAEIGADKKRDFHYSKLQRKQAVTKWKKRRKIEWMKKMYHQGQLQTPTEDENLTALVDKSVQELAKFIEEEEEEDEILDWELDELLAWTNTLNFEDYTQEWSQLACSQSYEPRKDSSITPT